MKLTALTCTYNRPEAFSLCEKYVARQTRQPDQWLVLDGPEPMHVKVADAIRDGKIEGDAILWTEDDDWISTRWFEWCEKRLDKGFELVGQGMAFYYNVNHRWWSNCNNVRHASLCQTAMRSSLLPHTWNIIHDFGCPWIDVQLWNIECNKYLHLPKDGEYLVVGIKGMPGTKGYSREHRQVNYEGNEKDLDLAKLRSQIGDDADLYAPFYDSSSEDELLKLAGAFNE